MSSTYKTILVPLDGSKRAEMILGHVEELARRYEATVVFVQVVEPEPLVVVPEMPDARLHRPQLENIAEQAKEYLDALQGEYREKGIASRFRVLSGPVVTEILKAAEQENADLVALASHGRTGLSKVFYGSVAAGLLNRIDRPLLLVRAR
jgi:nucleotide-binding universal stress UspA family protein